MMLVHFFVFVNNWGKTLEVTTVLSYVQKGKEWTLSTKNRFFMKQILLCFLRGICLQNFWKIFFSSGFLSFFVSWSRKLEITNCISAQKCKNFLTIIVQKVELMQIIFLKTSSHHKTICWQRGSFRGFFSWINYLIFSMNVRNKYLK